MPCSGDIKAKRPIPLTTPQILPLLFPLLFLHWHVPVSTAARICAGLAPRD